MEHVSVQKLKLKDNHTWKSRPGYSICVIERGLVRFDYPSDWIVEPEEGAVHLHDQAPSVESCDLGVSIFQVPAQYVHEIELDDLLKDTTKDRKTSQQSDLHRITRMDLEIVWLEQRYIDPEYKRDARFRVALARGPVICLISMNYWADRAEGLEPVWDEALRTLVMGVRVKDPTAGPVVQ
jgi:hypothetical protein